MLDNSNALTIRPEGVASSASVITSVMQHEDAMQSNAMHYRGLAQSPNKGCTIAGSVCRKAT